MPGKSSAKVDPARLSIAIGGVKVFSKGTGTKFDLKKVQQHLAGKEIKVQCDLGLDAGNSRPSPATLARVHHH